MYFIQCCLFWSVQLYSRTSFSVTWCDSSTALMIRTPTNCPCQNRCTPSAIACAADLWPPPVSEEMIRILGGFGCILVHKPPWEEGLTVAIGPKPVAYADGLCNLSLEGDLAGRRE